MKAAKVSHANKKKTFKKSERIMLTPAHDAVLVEDLFNFDSDLFFQKAVKTKTTRTFVVGIDEVGVACLAGPVVSACFAYETHVDRAPWIGAPIPVPVFDSKNLSEEEKLETEKWLRLQDSIYFEYGEAGVDEIDTINIYHATGLAMIRALRGVFKKILEAHKNSMESFKFNIVIDGNRIPKGFPRAEDFSKEFFVKNIQMQVSPLVKGDTKCFAVAAASIFAKNKRDFFMTQLGLAPEFQVYGWDSNVGYPTPKHRQAIKENGRTPWHRKSFRC